MSYYESEVQARVSEEKSAATGTPEGEKSATKFADTGVDLIRADGAIFLEFLLKKQAKLQSTLKLPVCRSMLIRHIGSISVECGELYQAVKHGETHHSVCCELVDILMYWVNACNCVSAQSDDLMAALEDVMGKNSLKLRDANP